MRSNIKRNKVNRSFAKEFFVLAILFFVMLAITLPITIAWFTDSYSESSASEVNFGAISVSGSDTIKLLVDKTPETVYDKAQHVLFPGNELYFKVSLENTSGVDIFLLSGCGISVYYVDETFQTTAFNQLNSSQKAQAIITDIEENGDSASCKNFTSVFGDINKWIKYNNIKPTNGLVNSKDYGNMVALSTTDTVDKDKVVVMNGSLTFDLNMPAKFIYDGKTYDIMGNSTNYYLFVNLFVETIQGVEIDAGTAYSELSRLVANKADEMGAKGFWDGSTSLDLVVEEDDEGNKTNLIQSAADLSFLNNNAGLIQGNIKLTNNLDLDGREWETKAVLSNNFDGGGKTITGYEINTDAGTNKKVGLFSTIQEGVVVENLIIKDSDINMSYNNESSTHSYGVLASYNFGEIRNCVIDGINANTFIDAAPNSGSSAQSAQIGGIVGTNYGLVESCINRSNIEAKADRSAYIGGIVGVNSTTSKNGVDFTGFVINCINEGTILSEGYRYIMSGGIVGQNYRGGIIANCYNAGDLKVTYRAGFNNSGAYCGGIAGDNQGGNYIASYIINCLNSGKQQVFIISNPNSDPVSYDQCGGVSGQSFATAMADGLPSNSSIALNTYFIKNNTFNTNVGITKEYTFGSDSPTNYLSCGYASSVSASEVNIYTPGLNKTSANPTTTKSGSVQTQLNNFWTTYKNTLKNQMQTNLASTIIKPPFEMDAENNRINFKVLESKEGETLKEYKVSFKQWIVDGSSVSLV